MGQRALLGRVPGGIGNHEDGGRTNRCAGRGFDPPFVGIEALLGMIGSGFQAFRL